MTNSRLSRPQFSIRTLLWLTLVVAAFLGGMLFDRMIARGRGYFHIVEKKGVYEIRKVE